jgi:hypothetical protein
VHGGALTYGPLVPDRRQHRECSGEAPSIVVGRGTHLLGGTLVRVEAMA